MKLPDNVALCGVPYIISEHEGIIVFANNSGFSGHSGRMCFEYISFLWHLTNLDITDTWDTIPVCHITAAIEMVNKYKWTDHKEANDKGGE